MSLNAILSQGRTHWGTSVGSKKRLLEQISVFVADDNSQFNADDLFNELLARERLGSTGIGHGVAIPHCRSQQCTAITGILLKLAEPIDFEAIDDQPVDLVFALIVPAEAHDEHIKALASLANVFNDDGFRQQLRSAGSDEALYTTAVTRAP